MYTYNEIEKLLSKQAKTLFVQDITLFTEFEKNASEIVKNIITVSEPPQDFIRQPFVWILEYLIFTQFSGQTQELINIITTNYNNALKILQAGELGIKNETSSKVLPFNDVYSVEE